MSYGDVYDGLSYDDKLISEKLEFAYSNKEFDPSYNKHHVVTNKLTEKELINKMVQEEIEKHNKKTNNTVDKTLDKVISKINNKQENNEKHNESDDVILLLAKNKVLFLFIFILVISVIVQYLNQQTMMEEIKILRGMLSPQKVILQQAPQITQGVNSV